MRAAAATLALAVAFMGAAPTLAFCQAMCLPATTPAHHQVAPAHHHSSHASTPRSDLLLKDNAGCKSEVQAALLRRQDSRAVERWVGTVAAASLQLPFFLMSAMTQDSVVSDETGPPDSSPLRTPLRV
jgi:hypothetical protein